MARGEIGSALYGRVDVAAYQIALRTAINMIIHAHGGASNRAGTEFVCPCMVHPNDSSVPPSLIEFRYNVSDTYILEFGDQEMRVIRNGAQVLESAKTITNITQASPAVVTSSAHGFQNGDDIYIDGVVGMTEVNGRWFQVQGKTTNTFQLRSQQTSAVVNSTGYGAYTSGGEAARVYSISTPYAISDVARLKHVQSANVMTLTHPSYNPRKLSRTDHDAWTLEEITFAPEQDHPTGLAVTPDTTSNKTDRYQVTAVSEETQEESLPGLDGTTETISGATKADPCVITATGHSFADGDEIEINGIVGMEELNGRRFTVANKTTNTFELEGEDSTSYSAYSSGGSANRTFAEATNSANPPDNEVSWTAVSGAGRYSVYRKENGLYGWIGDTEDTSFLDENIEADLTLTPPKARNPFFGSDNCPRAVSYYEQRRVFGSSVNKPDTSWYSVTASQANLSHSSPRQPDDAITTTLNSLEVNEIRAFVPLDDLLVFTSGAEWKVNSTSDESGFTAATLQQKPQSNWGISYLDPIVAGDKVLFVTENSRSVRSIGYEITIDGYSGNDMTVFAPHLFETLEITDWAYARYPDPLVAVVREDGWVACLTFNPEQEVVAWGRWKTKAGKFKRVASTNTSDNSDPHFYFVVQRKVGSFTHPFYFIERVHSRRFDDVRDCFFVDSGLSYDSPHNVTNIQEGISTNDGLVHFTVESPTGFADGDLVDVDEVEWMPNFSSTFTETQPSQLNGSRYKVAALQSSGSDQFVLANETAVVSIEGATQADPCVITSTGHGLSDGTKIAIFDVGGMTQLNGSVYEVSNPTDDTFELYRIGGVTSIDSTGYGAYTSGGNVHLAVLWDGFNDYVDGGVVRKPAANVSGLWHLEGDSVVVLADGEVVTGKTISDGQLDSDLSTEASRIHVGLRMVADLETLNPEIANGGGTIQGRSQRVPSLTVRFKDSQGVLMGPDENTLEAADFSSYDELHTGDHEMHIASDWEGGGRVYLRQPDPLPLTVTAIIPHLEVGDEDERE